MELKVDDDGMKKRTIESKEDKSIELGDYKQLKENQDDYVKGFENNIDTSIIIEESCWSICKKRIAACMNYKGNAGINVFMIIFEILGVIFYLIGLKGCSSTQTECLIYYSENAVGIIVTFAILSCLSVCTCIILVIHKIIHYSHLIILSCVYIIICFFNFGANLDDHGAYNFFGSVLIILILLMLYGIILGFYKLFRKGRYITIGIIIGSVLIISIVYYIRNWRDSCKDFYKGLGGKSLINDPNENLCNFPKPDVCTLPNFDGVFDYSRMIFLNCKAHDKNEKKVLMRYLNESIRNGTRFAFPSSVGYDLKQQKNLFQFNKDMLDSVIDLDQEKTKNHHEVTLTFDEKDLGHISIDVKKNETLIKEREEIRKKLNQNFLYKNILFIYIDAFSRNHFLRKMKETTKFIEQYLYDSSKENDKERVSFQFFKYHSFSYWTHISVAPMFYGATMADKNGTNLVKYFKENGYITGMTEDYCSKELFDVERGDYNQNRNWEDWDHENVVMFCDPNYHNRDFPYPEWKGAYCSLRRCLYGRDTFEYAIEYAEQFWEAYINEPKFFRLAFIDAHEGSMEVIKYVDSPLMNMIKSFDEKGWLENTAIIFASDHGDNMVGIHRVISPDFHMERFYATLFIVLPNTKDEVMQKQFKNLEINAQRFISPFDIHDTLLYLLHYNDNQKQLSYSQTGQTVFEVIDSKVRSCSYYRDFQSGVCICRSFDKS